MFGSVVLLFALVCRQPDKLLPSLLLTTVCRCHFSSLFGQVGCFGLLFSLSVIIRVCRFTCPPMSLLMPCPGILLFSSAVVPVHSHLCLPSFRYELLQPTFSKSEASGGPTVGSGLDASLSFDSLKPHSIPGDHPESPGKPADSEKKGLPVR